MLINLNTPQASPLELSPDSHLTSSFIYGSVQIFEGRRYDRNPDGCDVMGCGMTFVCAVCELGWTAMKEGREREKGSEGRKDSVVLEFYRVGREDLCVWMRYAICDIGFERCRKFAKNARDDFGSWWVGMDIW